MKTEEFLLIEKCFSAIKSRIDVEENLHRIENTIKRIFDIDTVINISPNDSSDLYGVSVYPSPEIIDSVVRSIVKTKDDSERTVFLWSHSKLWYIEIDTKLLYNPSFNVNPSEIVAVLLHEIGHVIYSNRVPYKLWKIIRLKTCELPYNINQLLSNEKIRKLLNIAIIEACSIKNYVYYESFDEKISDEFVAQHGYGKELESFIYKLLKISGNDLINRCEEEMDKEIEITINWAVLNIKELEFRKKHLRSALKTELLKTPSKYIKNVIQNIYQAFFGDIEDRYRVLLSESYSDNPKDIYSELQANERLDGLIRKIMKESFGNMFDKRGKLKKINQSDIDILFVESEKIETVDDKIYLLDKLHYQMELVDKGLDYLESNERGLGSKVSQSKTTLLSYKKQLEKIRAQIIATKIIDKEYGLFIKYPEGYQG